MNDPRPAMISARPPESRSTSAKLLEHAHGVVGAEHGDGAGKAYALGLDGGRPEHHGGRGDEEVRAVVLADGEHVEPELVGELRPPPSGRACAARGDAAAQIGECGEPQFHASSIAASSCVRNHLRLPCRYRDRRL